MEFLTYVAHAILISLGAAVTVNPDWAARNKARVGGTLVVFGFIALGLTGVQSSRENAELNKALETQSELVASNLKLQKENLALSTENRELANETLRVALGDPDNPPFLYVSDFDFGGRMPKGHAYVMNSSVKYAAQNVTVSLKLDGETVTSVTVSIPPSNRTPAALPNRVGVVSNSIDVPSLAKVGARATYVSVIASSAGSYQQVTGMVRSTDSRVLQATRVSKLNDRRKIIFSREDAAFPKDFVWPLQSAEDAQ